MTEVLTWQGCYGEKWDSDEIYQDPEMQHPAKFSKRLIYSMVDFGIKKNYWSKGSFILDPFAGAACGGVVCSYRGLRWVGIELEKKLAKSCKKTFAIHSHIWNYWENPLPIIIQGDSRELPVKSNYFDGIITSPPFGELIKGAGLSQEFSGREGYEITVSPIGSAYVTDLQATDDRNVALLKGNEYYKACFEIYKQCHIALKPGGVIFCVVKDYVRDGKIVPVCDETAKIMSQTGFEIFFRIHAMQVEKREQMGLFGDVITEEKQHKGFFRQLQERKGAPKIDYEEVICGRKIC